MVLRKARLISLLLSIVIISCSLTQLEGCAQSNSFILEAEQPWDTYGSGATCISGSHNLFLENIDGDVYVEIITGGSSYGLTSNGTVTPREAPLKIWKWNGQNLTLKTKHNWPGNINCVYAADVDSDGQFELLTSGYMSNDSGSYPSLRVWRWDGTSLALRASVEGIPTSSIFVSDLDRDGVQEIVTVGRFNSTSQHGAKLCVWHLEEDGLALQKSVEWCVSNVTSVSSVFARDLDNDGRIEIVTSGYTYELRNSSGQLRVWHYNVNGFSLKSSEEWRLVEGVYGLNIAGGIQGNTLVNNLKVGDVDSDGTPEIVTGGFAYDGENTNAQLRIWSWNGENLLLEKSEEWATDYLTEIKCVSLGDIDGDSRLDIVTSGGVGEKGSFANNATSPTQAQLRVWDWDGTSLVLKQSKEWTIGDGFIAWNVASSDVDGDGVVEIVTVGCMGIGSLCDPDMRLWSVPSTDGDPLFLNFLYAVVIAVILISAGVFLALKKRR